MSFPSNFRTFDITVSNDPPVTIHGRTAGSGPPLLLIHGHPQSHLMWSRIAAPLAERFTVVAPDLRGHGDSSKPAPDEEHERYSKRAMARDQVEVMKQLGFEKFNVLGHDRGARVTHRMAMDHPDRVQRAMLLDIAPTLTMYEKTDMAFAKAYWHWFFLIQARAFFKIYVTQTTHDIVAWQPAPFPEDTILAAPKAYLDKLLGIAGGGDLSLFDKADVSSYLSALSDRAAVQAYCEAGLFIDYRAAATIDLEHDRADSGKLACPTRVLWGGLGVVGRLYDVVAEWRKVAKRDELVSGRAVEGSGHYIPEEKPEEVLEEALWFFGNQ